MDIRSLILAGVGFILLTLLLYIGFNVERNKVKNAYPAPVLLSDNNMQDTMPKMAGVILTKEEYEQLNDEEREMYHQMKEKLNRVVDASQELEKDNSRLEQQVEEAEAKNSELNKEIDQLRKINL